MICRHLTFAALLLSPLAHAASTVDLSVKGLITPSACEPTLSNGGVHDLGKIAARDLNIDQPTRLPTHELQLEITCEALTLVALEPRDNRLGSSYDEAQPNKFGLGLVNGNIKLGYMELRVLSAEADGAQMYPLSSTNSSTWAPTDILSPHFLTAFTPIKSVQVPASIQQLNANLRIAPTIAPANTLPLTEEIPIDGSATVTVKYL